MGRPELNHLELSHLAGAQHMTLPTVRLSGEMAVIHQMLVRHITQPELPADAAALACLHHAPGAPIDPPSQAGRQIPLTGGPITQRETKCEALGPGRIFEALYTRPSVAR